MLFIFRQLRRLELRQRSGRYFVYAIGEILLIVIGILIALQIQNWNEKRLDRIEERYLLMDLVDNLKQDAERLEDAVEKQSQQIEGLTRIGGYLDSDSIPEEPFREDLDLLGGYFAFSPVTSAYETMKNNGSSISNRELKKAMLHYYDQEIPLMMARVESSGTFVKTYIIPVIIEYFFGGPNRDSRTPKDFDDPAWKEALLHVLGPKIVRTTRSLERTERLLEKTVSSTSWSNRNWKNEIKKPKLAQRHEGTEVVSFY